MSESVEYARTFKQPRPLTRGALPTHCATCGHGLVDGSCFWDDHGCRNGCGPISLRNDAACDVCGVVTFRCPGDGCRSAIHKGEPA